MDKVIHRADTRGYADHGWLRTFHTFSFAGYYDPHRIHFGALRVLNDDTVAGGKGFGTHPHDNMEIVSIPLSGTLMHRDSMGHAETLSVGEIQVMSAGMGITHSEYNADPAVPVQFLQIWIMTDRRNHTPRYETVRLDPPEKNRLRLIVAPEGFGDSGHTGWLHQTTWFYTADIEAGREVEYVLNGRGDGVYLFVLEGRVEVGDATLGRRDGMGILNTERVAVRAADEAQVLLIEVPM